MALLRSKKIKNTTILIILLGIVSLFADFVYEGGASIIPQFFTVILGGSVFLLGIVIGIGDFLGYSFRLVSGKLADTTHKYWALIFIGYAVNVVAIPLLALSGNYIMAAFLIFAERLGKAIRTPSKDYVISEAADKKKMGRAFAINEILDQTGAVIGPIVMSLIILWNGSYRAAFGFLLVPAILTMIVLVIAHTHSKKISVKEKREKKEDIMAFPQFVIYSFAVAISAAGLYQVAFILYGAQGVVSTYLIPIIFLVAMVGEGSFGFIFGLLYDRIGRALVYLGVALPIAIPLLLVHASPSYLFAAALVFGAVVGIQDTVMRAVVGSMIQKEKRGFAFGIFNTLYGFGLLVSGIAVGYLYHSLTAIILYVVVLQIISFAALAVSFKKGAKKEN